MNEPARFDPLWSAAAPGGGHQARFSAIGLGVEVIANEEWILEIARRSFGAFEPAPDSAPCVTIDVFAASDARSAETPPASALRHRERAGLFTATDGASMVAADLPSGRAALFVDSHSDPDVVRRDLLEAIVWRFATWYGMIAIHAATIVIGNRSLVLRGTGGAGKSTLAYQAIRAGHALVAEEVTWVDPDTSRGNQSDFSGAPRDSSQPLLRGAPWRIGLEWSACDLFPELAPLRVPAEAGDGVADGRASVAPRKLVIERDDSSWAWRTAESAPIGPIVFLESVGESGRDEGSTWRRIEASEAQARFEAGAIVGENAQPPGAYRAAGSRLIAEGAFVLRAGRPESAIRALEEIALDRTAVLAAATSIS